jgi:lipoprotein-anchoring transpeptidase ErfK/SrfK
MRGPSAESGRARLAGQNARLASLLLALSLIGFGPAHAELAPTMRVSLVEPVSLAEATTIPPGAQVLAHVDLSEQKMELYVDDRLVDVFPVSTGRMGYGTPPGDYHAEWITAFWRSRKYHYAPMPWSVFFHGGYAIHGTTEVWRLGQPASHGCIRLRPDNAKIFYTLVLQNGNENTTITISR